MTHRQRNGQKPLKIIVISGLLLSASGAMIWSMRPVWHTDIIHDGTPANTRLIVQYPEGWRIKAIDDRKLTRVLTRPSGLSEWWAQYFLKQDLNAWKSERILVGLEENTSIQSASDVEREYTMLLGGLRRAFKSVTSTTVNQNGTQGLNIEAHQAVRPLLSNKCMRFLLLYKKSAKTGRLICYDLQVQTTEEKYRTLKPTIDEIIRRLRLVEDTRALQKN